MLHTLKNFLRRFPAVFSLCKKIRQTLNRLKPERTTQEDILYVLFGWVPGSLGFSLRYFFWKRYFKHLGKNVRIFPGVHILGSENISIDDEATLWFHSQLYALDNASLTIGKKAFITGTHINASGGNVTIGSHCALAPRVTIRATNHIFENPDIPIMLQGNTRENIILEDDVWVAANAVILPGATIRKGCVVAAGAVVARGEIEPYSVVGGVPAKLLKKRGSGNAGGTEPQ